MRITSPGQLAFAVVMITLGIQGLITGDFTAIWWPVPKGVPAREVLAYLCALVSLASGAGLLWTRTATPAARVLLGYLLAWALLFRVPVILRAPAEFLPWDGCAETAVMVAGAWALYVRFAGNWDRLLVGFASGERGVRIARALNGLAMIAFGLAHFAYLQHTAELVPGWLPAHLFWAKLTGWTFLAAGAGMLLNILARRAAALAALQIGLFTLLVWVPILAAGSKDASQWMEFATSAALTAGAWVVAESYR
jgi:uncharacterized membrane protein